MVGQIIAIKQVLAHLGKCGHEPHIKYGFYLEIETDEMESESLSLHIFLCVYMCV